MTPSHNYYEHREEIDREIDEDSEDAIKSSLYRKKRIPLSTSFCTGYWQRLK
jgi:hypothetical protein